MIEVDGEIELEPATAGLVETAADGSRQGIHGAAFEPAVGDDHVTADGRPADADRRAIDVLAVGPRGVLAVQTTSAANVAPRIRKIADHANVAAVREAGIAIHVHGWRKRAGRWELHRNEDVS